MLGTQLQDFHRVQSLSRDYCFFYDPDIINYTQ